MILSEKSATFRDHARGRPPASVRLESEQIVAHWQGVRFDMITAGFAQAQDGN
jgi:hypothetical protein